MSGPLIDYDSIDINELTNLLLTAVQRADVRRAALSALSRRDPIQRNSRLVLAMQYVVRYPDRYDQDLMMSLIDILATDPDSYATTAMLDVLADLVGPLLEGRRALTPEFRQYFYEALSTRQRPEDQAVIAEMVPTLEPRTLVGILADPLSEPALEMLKVLKVLDNMPEPQRTGTLMFAVAAVARTGAPVGRAKAVGGLLRKSHASQQFSQGIKKLEQQWRAARRSGRKGEARTLVAGLRAMDPRPRSLFQILLGRRPWASLFGG